MSSTQSSQQLPQPKAARQRTSAERQRRDRYSVAARWAGLTARTPEGRFLKDVRADLVRHVGGKPTTAQRVLIERACMLQLQLARMDAKALETGAMSAHASREYLAWCNSLRRCMAELGMKGEPPPAPTLADIMASIRPVAA